MEFKVWALLIYGIGFQIRGIVSDCRLVSRAILRVDTGFYIGIILLCAVLQSSLDPCPGGLPLMLTVAHTASAFGIGDTGIPNKAVRVESNASTARAIVWRQHEANRPHKHKDSRRR